mmetsp:Transcript_12072/g.41036  ORF Transcript_12072/g.41036 Transcript_12072/m.41036 type:complete len:222 (+) Transcript_12072:1459-2124(+)
MGHRHSSVHACSCSYSVGSVEPLPRNGASSGCPGEERTDFSRVTASAGKRLKSAQAAAAGFVTAVRTLLSPRRRSGATVVCHRWHARRGQHGWEPRGRRARAAALPRAPGRHVCGTESPRVAHAAGAAFAKALAPPLLACLCARGVVAFAASGLGACARTSSPTASAKPLRSKLSTKARASLARAAASAAGSSQLLAGSRMPSGTPGHSRGNARPNTGSSP